MISALKGEVASLPPSPRINFIREALLKERRMRERVLSGSERQSKVEEMATCLDYLDHIDAALSKAREMVSRLQEAAARHGIEKDGLPIDEAIIAALDEQSRKG